MNFDFWKEEWVFTKYSYPCCLHGLEEMIKSMGKGAIIVASIFPASRIVVKPIKCEFFRILDNKLLLEDIEIWLLQMKCEIRASLFV